MTVKGEIRDGETMRVERQSEKRGRDTVKGERRVRKETGKRGREQNEKKRERQKERSDIGRGRQ